MSGQNLENKATRQDKTTLRPFRPDLPAHFISDACSLGISASVYQEEKGGDLVPVDHVDRARSATEQGWDSQIEWESLGKSWGLQMLRSYLISKHFTSWGDHFPLVPLFNNLSKPASRRVAKYRQQVQDLSFRQGNSTPAISTVVDVQGTQITAVRHGATKIRDSQRFKKVAPKIQKPSTYSPAATGPVRPRHRTTTAYCSNRAATWTTRWSR